MTTMGRSERADHWLPIVIGGFRSMVCPRVPGSGTHFLYPLSRKNARVVDTGVWEKPMLRLAT